MKQTFIEAYTDMCALLHSRYSDQIDFNIHMTEERELLLNAFGWDNASKTWQQNKNNSN